MQYLVERESHPHKILGLGRTIAPILGLIVCLGVFGLLQFHKSRFVFLSDGVYFVDGDCYSRMARVRLVAEQPGILIKRHGFENYPLGVRPHTTAPMDYLILGAARLLGDRYDLDFAGAWISPVLGVFLILLAWIWGERRKIPYRWCTVTLLSISPVVLHGFAVGRPDHQSLVLLLTGSGILAETALWAKRSVWASLWWGLSWGFALWVSWFEPLLLLLLVLIVRILVWRSQCLVRAWMPALGIATTVVLVAVIVEGLPDAGLGENSGSSFFQWATRIGELQSFHPLSAAIAWIGWLALLLPFALAWMASQRKHNLCWLWLTLLLSMAALTAWHARWGYFLALSGAFAMPAGLGVIRKRWLGYSLFVASLWPVASVLDRELFPQGEAGRIFAENLYESRQLRQAAEALKDLEGNGILGPWWLTPQLVYWSGKDGVAGSSHESLAGTIDTARFFVAQDDTNAKSILLKRHPDFVVVCNADRLLDNSYTVLGKIVSSTNQLAAVLFRTPSRAPNYLRLVFQNPSFKVYKVQKEML
jgi:hypothetical protein